VRDDVMELTRHGASLFRGGRAQASLGLADGTLRVGLAIGRLDAAGPDQVADEPRGHDDGEGQHERFQDGRVLGDEPDGDESGDGDHAHRGPDAVASPLAGREACQRDGQDGHDRRPDRHARRDTRHRDEEQDGERPATPCEERQDHRQLRAEADQPNLVARRPAQDDETDDQPDVQGNESQP
jgi:hypothetical protein